MKKNKKLMDFVRRAEYKRRLEAHEVWGHVGGRLYTLTKIVYTIAFALAMLVNLTYLFFWCNRYFSERELLADPASARNAILVVGLMSLVLAAGYIFVAKQKPSVYLPCTLASSVVLSLHFYGEMGDILASQGFLPYLFKHLLWYIFLCLTALILFLIQARENAALSARYAKLEAQLYSRASAETGVTGVFTEDDWQRLLEAYDGAGPEKPLSRSEKIRRRKEAEEAMEENETPGTPVDAKEDMNEENA